MSVTVAGTRLELHPHAAAYWPARDTLLVADLHLGKATHFRRHGIAVPDYVQHETLDKLSGLLLDFAPARLLVLGDLFHSDYNPEWEDFADLRLGFQHVAFGLVLGNHDRLTAHQYAKYGIHVEEEPYDEGPFRFSHHPLAAEESIPGQYNLAGHVHPAAALYGPRGDRLRLPCFYFGQADGLLPAFGSFTGNYTVSPRRGDRVFVIAEDKVLNVN